MSNGSLDEWIKVATQMPQAELKVRVKGSDFAGEWSAVAWWQPYKGKPPKGNKYHGRWMWQPKDRVERLGSKGDVDSWQPYR